MTLPQNIPHEKEKCVLSRHTEVFAMYCDLKWVKEDSQATEYISKSREAIF